MDLMGRIEEAETGDVVNKEPEDVGFNLMDRIQEAEKWEPTDADQWKQQGNAAYKKKDYSEAIRCYTSALKYCSQSDDIGLACLNNRAACYAQMKEHSKVISDASKVISKQPANCKALLRRMVALDILSRTEEALKDAADVLTMEPKNPHALQLVNKKRQSLSQVKRTHESADDGRPTEKLTLFVFSEDRPMHLYACLKSAFSHLKRVVLQVHVFWQATKPTCQHSYQLLQGLKELQDPPYGEVTWVDVSRGQLWPTFQRNINKYGGSSHSRFVLILSDCVLFHSDWDATAGIKLLEQRSEVFALRLDLHPRIEHFVHPQPEYAFAPRLEEFSGDRRVLLWSRQFERGRPAYEKVRRESGWHAILEWTASMVRITHLQLLFSGLQGPINDMQTLDEKSADWLSRRQRFREVNKRGETYDASEVPLKTGCLMESKIVALERNAFGNAEDADSLLRAHLREIHSSGSGQAQQHESAIVKLAKNANWSRREVEQYLQSARLDISEVNLLSIVDPEIYKGLYFDSVVVPLEVAEARIPPALSPPAPLVTWLIPVRNSESLVLDALRSIEAQSGLGAGSYEVVIIDDDSEDETRQVLERYCASNPLARTIDNVVRMGVAGCLSHAWPHCRGDFIARLDADDVAEPTRILTQLRYLDSHASISILGSSYRSFFSEDRYCTIEKLAEKSDGRLAMAIWRKEDGSDAREQVILAKNSLGDITCVEGPADYKGSRLIRVGDHRLVGNPDNWVDAVRSAKGAMGRDSEVVFQRTDPPEGRRQNPICHPVLLRLQLLFEEAVCQTTAIFRRRDFPDEGPYHQEEAEGHWCWLALPKHLHIANIADILVMKRRHLTNRLADGETQQGCYESQCAAVQHFFHQVANVMGNISMQDGAALLNFRGPSSPEQGDRLIDILDNTIEIFEQEYITPAELDEQWADFVAGRENELRYALRATRNKFAQICEQLKEVVIPPEKSPRESEKRERDPPR